MDDFSPSGSATTPSTSSSTSTSTPPPPWVGLFTGVALAIAIVSGLQVIGSIMAGLAVGNVPLGTAYKIGYSFYTSLDRFPLGLALLLAVLLVTMPAVGHAPTSDRHE